MQKNAWVFAYFPIFLQFFPQSNSPICSLCSCLGHTPSPIFCKCLFRASDSSNIFLMFVVPVPPTDPAPGKSILSGWDQDTLQQYWQNIGRVKNIGIIGMTGKRHTLGKYAPPGLKALLKSVVINPDREHTSLAHRITMGISPKQHQ